MEDECQFHEESPCRPIECWMQSELVSDKVEKMERSIMNADHTLSLIPRNENYQRESKACHENLGPLIALFKRVRKCARAKCRAIQLGEKKGCSSVDIPTRDK
jgi:hypothetical protein